MRLRWFACGASVALAVAGVLGACGGSPGNALLFDDAGVAGPDATVVAHACIPGQQVACTCPGGAVGAQVCAADGTGFGTCMGCGASEASASSGGPGDDASGVSGGDDSGSTGGDDDGSTVGGDASSGGGDDSGASGNDSGAGGQDAGRHDAGTTVDAGSDAGTVTCPAGKTTTLSGTVYDPAGVNPLYGVSVYVPSEPPGPLPTGLTCSCEGLYPLHPITIAQTDALGRFTLKNVPNQSSVPLVVQIGKWRTQTTAALDPCQANTAPDKSLTLPKNHLNGNDLPQLAISTGAADSLECLLVRVGIDPGEFMPGAAGPGHIHIFQGGGSTALGTGAPNTSPPGPASSASLWDSTTDLSKFDMVFLSCEGVETASMNQAALFDYAALGGRIFASHYHYAWFDTGPFAADNMATWTTSTNDLGTIGATVVTKLPNGNPFAKGEALLSWMTNLQILDAGELTIQSARHNADVGLANAPSEPWLVADADSGAPGATQYFSYNTTTAAVADGGPVKSCGRVVYSDIHVGAASGDYGGLTGLTQPIVPSGCTPGLLSPQEDALEFMLFDLSGCVTADQ